MRERNTSARFAAAVAGFGVAAVIAGAAVVASPAPARAQGNFGDTAVTRQPNSRYEARLRTDRDQYRPNRAVEVTLTLTSLINVRSSIATPDTGPYELTVRDARTNRVVYRLSRNRPRPGRGGVTLDPGESRTWRELWDQRDDAGQRVPSGTYVIEATIHPQNTVSKQVFLSGRDDSDDGNGRPDRPDRPGRPGRPGDPDFPGNPGGGYLNGVSGSLRASQATVRPGDSVTLTYTAQNTLQRPVALSFATGKQFDVTVNGFRGGVVWQDSAGKMYTQAFRTITLNPGQKLTYASTWRVGADTPGGAYTVSAFLTPATGDSAAGLTGRATATVRVENGRGNSGGNGPFFPGPGNGSQQPNRIVSLRDLSGSLGERLVGQRVTVSGTFLGRKGGYGAPPEGRSDWVIAGEGMTMYVSGTTPPAREGGPIQVTGTVRRTSDGRIYIALN